MRVGEHVRYQIAPCGDRSEEERPPALARALGAVPPSGAPRPAPPQQLAARLPWGRGAQNTRTRTSPPISGLLQPPPRGQHPPPPSQPSVPGRERGGGGRGRGPGAPRGHHERTARIVTDIFTFEAKCSQGQNFCSKSRFWVKILYFRRNDPPVPH